MMSGGNKKKKDVAKLIGLLAGLMASYKVMNSFKGSAEEEAPLPVTWISADDESEETIQHMPLKPKFYLGERVLIVNPYTEEHVVDTIDDYQPLSYTINAYKYDAHEDVFRYRLTGQYYDWYSEEWLTSPEYSTMKTRGKRGTKIKEVKTDEMKLLTGPTEEAKEVQAIIISRVLDGYARQRSVDILLDKMNNGTEDERNEARRKLEELSDKGEI